MNEIKLSYQWHNFDTLSVSQLYSLLALRQQVFVVEQDCPYQDCDNRDQTSHHLLALEAADSGEQLAAYLRIIPPDKSNASPRIGRLVTRLDKRGNGLGKELMQRAIERCVTLYPGHSILISAQMYLEKFYTNIGFVTKSAPYEEDGIPHIRMELDNAD